MEKPRVIQGICEFCGIPASECIHHAQNFNRKVEDIVINSDTPLFSRGNMKIADIIIPHHTNNRDLVTLLDRLDLSIFNVIICSGGSFAENCNKGARVAETDVLFFINDDVEITNDQMIKLAINVGKYNMVSSTQLAGIESINKYWGISLNRRDGGIIEPRISLKKDISLFPSGFLFGIEKKVWEKIGGFDERFRTGNEDVDFGLKFINLGFSSHIFDLEVRHKESQSKGRFTYCKENEDLLDSLWSQDKLKTIYNNNY